MGRASTGAGTWLEVGDRVFSRRYRFFDQQIGAILTDAGPIVVDTRSSAGQAREIAADLAALTSAAVAAVINTHHHYDHSFGNGVFRPAPIWGHIRCAETLRRHGQRMIERTIDLHPDLADDLRATEVVPPDRTFSDAATLEVGGRTIELRHLGRGHTDDDIVAIVPDAAVLFAGDLVEEGAPPYFGDAFPLDWPGTLEAMLPLVTGRVVPGHGAVGEAAFVARQIAEIRAIADLGRRVGRGELSLDEGIAAGPYPATEAREPLERALAQLRGELD